ncbi:polyribonucleotide nucleotidyltransferase [Candidatus Mcinerneyibacteriota bacterium]|nr:polyribonucleotide nucleotidyltransferase [Candidatus Mcinerneyibacteriota bacterium]
MSYKVTMEIGGRTLSLETGRMAKQADGSCLVRFGDTMVLVTAVGSRTQSPMDFFPLTVEYREKSYAAGKIPGGFFKREGKPSDEEVLSARMIDRPIRPLFADDFQNEVQVYASVISSDKENTPDVLGITGASQALMLSGLPFNGPVAGVRVGLIDGAFVLNPTHSQLESSEMDMIVAGTEKAVTMVEGFINKLTEEQVLEGIMLAHEEIKKICALQHELVKAAGQTEFTYEPFAIPEDMERVIDEAVGSRIDEIFNIKGKLERQKALAALFDEAKALVMEKDPDIDSRKIGAAFHNVEKKHVRKSMLKTKVRVDGRSFDEVRPITVEVGVLPRTHGSALFTRGETQALATVTLGSAGDQQILDALRGESKKKFMLHYNFPPFSVNEVKRIMGPGRREIGHGMLAERAITPVLPGETFPYTIRIVSDILESNGSSSMATVCGGSLSLMDAGVPISDTVAGTAMGLLKEGDDFIILTDILGSEDHLGDMDFKIAGTRDRVTAIQMDIKIEGVTKEIMQTALAQAKKARLHIIEKMEEVLAEPRKEQSPYAPSILMCKVPVDKIGEIIGPGGKNIKGMSEEFNSEIWIDDDGTIQISSENRADGEAAVARIQNMTKEYEVGDIVEGVVSKIVDFGAFCSLPNGKGALVHISEISKERIPKVSDVLSLGDKVKAKVIKIDDMGRINISIKRLEEE